MYDRAKRGCGKGRPEYFLFDFNISESRILRAKIYKISVIESSVEKSNEEGIHRV